MKVPTFATGQGASLSPSREAFGRSNNSIDAKKADAAVFTVRPPFLLSLLCLDLLLFQFLFSFGKFPLAFLAFIESKNIREDAACYRLDPVLGHAGVTPPIPELTDRKSVVKWKGKGQNHGIEVALHQKDPALGLDSLYHNAQAGIWMFA